MMWSVIKYYSKSEFSEGKNREKKKRYGDKVSVNAILWKKMKLDLLVKS